MDVSEEEERGYHLVLMLAGLAGLVLGFVQQSMWSRRSRREVAIEDRRDPREPY